MSGARLAFAAVVKLYGARAALDHVSLTVEPGRFVVLLGPSGSGKTTLLRCAAGIERVSAGSIVLDDRGVDDGRRQTPPEQRDLAMVFQDYALWPHMTALENVRYALRRTNAGKDAARTRSLAMLERVGLLRLSGNYPSELSGGEQQRVALARALVANPRLLLFDEPLSNLDANLRDQMRVQIATLVRESGASALYITHDQAEAFALADEIGVLEAGRLAQFGAPEEIYRAPATPFVGRLTGLAGEFRGQVQRLAGDVVEVEAAGTLLVGRPLAPLQTGAAVRVLVRPAGVRLVDAEEAGTRLVATVQDVAFAGRGYEHVIEGAGVRLGGIFAARRWERGTRVGATIDPISCLVYPDDPAAH